MRCMACGAEMRVVEVAADDTMRVAGYEYHTLQCSGCDDIERRLVFSREATVRPAKPAPPHQPSVAPADPPAELPLAAQPVPTPPTDEPAQFAAKPVAAPLPAAAAPAEPVLPPSTPPTATAASPEAVSCPVAATLAAEAPAATAAPPAEPAPRTTQPSPVPPATDDSVDEGEAMRCLVCGAEMRVVEVAADDTMRVSGYEYHTLQCSGCDDIERRLVFSREAIVRPAKPAPPPPPVATTAPPADPPLAAPPISTPPADEPVRSASESVAVTLPAAAAPAEPTLSPVAVTLPAEAPAAASPPAEPAPAAVAQPSSVPPPADDNVDEGEALLRRAIEMVRGPVSGAQPTKGLSDGQPATPSALAASMRSKKLLTRVVQIQRDPDEPSYIAKDTKSGLSVLRHQDSARLRAMCDRIGWQVVDG
jgi:hypothetical protein